MPDDGSEPLPTIPGYSISAEIGRGGMARVYRAVQTMLERNVALKVMAPEIAGRKRSVDRFLREARLAAQINHPNVVTVYDLGLVEERPFIAMELVEGGDSVALAKASDGRLPERRALELARDCCRGLAAIHRAGMLHRDLKPHNILIAVDGGGKIADLGLACAAETDDHLTVQNASVGTPAYMSPEQAKGTEDLDSRTDLYALGATLYAWVCGRPPYDGNQSWVVISKVINEAPEDPRAFGGVSENLATLIERAMAKGPEQRFPDAETMLGEIERLLAAERVETRMILRSDREGGVEEVRPVESDVDPFEEALSETSDIFQIAATEQFTRPTTARHATGSGTTSQDPGESLSPLSSSSAATVPPHLARVEGILRPGTVVDDFRIKQPIADSAVAITYRAVEIATQKPALVQLVKSNQANNPGVRSACDRAVRALRLSDHPHVSGVLGAGEHEGRPYIAYEHQHDISLTRYIAEHGRVTPDRALAIFAQLLDGLALLERQELPHLAIEPGNIWVDAAGQVRLGPPALDPHANGAYHEATDHAAQIALAHRSPEHAVGQGNLGLASDLYSMGAVLYSMVGGRPPFEHHDPVELAHRVMTGEPRDLRDLLPDLPELAGALLDRLLAKDPAARPDGCEELQLELDRVNLGLPIKDRLRAILATGEIHDGAESDLIQLLSMMETDDPDREDMLRPALLIALNRPRRRTWEIVADLAGEGWYARKARHVAERWGKLNLRDPRRRLVVARRGGDFDDLPAAVAAAKPFDCIVLRAGVWSGGVTVDKPLFLIGNGPAKKIVVASEGGRAALKIASDGVYVCGLSFNAAPGVSGERSFGLEIAGADAVVLNCYATSTSLPSISVHGEKAAPYLADCRMRDGTASGMLFFDRAKGLVENCEFSGNKLAGIEITRHAAPEIRSCVIQQGQASGVLYWQHGGGELHHCTITDNKLAGVEVRGEGNPTIRKCRIHSGEHCGVLVHEQGRCRIEECEIANNKMPGIACRDGGAPVVVGSRIVKGYRSGVLLLEGGSAELEECTIGGNMSAGIEVRGGASIRAQRCTIAYGKSIGVMAKGGSKGFISDCIFDGASPLAAVKMEKGAGVAVENMRTRELADLGETEG